LAVNGAALYTPALACKRGSPFTAGWKLDT